MTTTSTILRSALAAAALVATTAAVVVASGSSQVGNAGGHVLNPASARDAQPAPSAESPRAERAQPPANVVSWPSRGVAPDPAFLEKALTVFARGLGAKRSDVESKVLFAGDDDSRNVYVFGQAWIKGSDAHTFGYTENGKGEATPFLGPVTGEAPEVLAFAMAPGTGQTRETLVVIPKPSVTKAYYGEAGSEYIEITGQEYLDGVKIIDRRPGVQGDMLKLLLANGDKAFEAKVETLLCGVKECG